MNTDKTFNAAEAARLEAQGYTFAEVTTLDDAEPAFVITGRTAAHPDGPSVSLEDKV